MEVENENETNTNQLPCSTTIGTGTSPGGETCNLLATSTREELIDKIHQLQRQVKQLRKRSAERHMPPKSVRQTKKQRQGKGERPFDFSIHPKRHVAIKISYLGWDFQGFAGQSDTDESIESHLFNALIRTKLIESRITSNYHRCGRTDKGVSAFSQVISLDLRCKHTEGIGVIPANNQTCLAVRNNETDCEIDYCKILNSVLPKEIRVLAWSPVRTGFSARFDCFRRTYKYFFPGVDLDIEKMRTAAQYLIGEHDFRNFCKLDTSGEKPTTRRMLSIDLTPCEGDTADSDYKLFIIKLTGNAFVWHQIRCVVAVLILVGMGLEEPEVVQQLLDTSKQPKKPQYAMAVDFPLILFDVDHGNEIDWKYSEDNVYSLLADFQCIWVQNSIKSQMVWDVIKTLENDATQSRSATTNSGKYFPVSLQEKPKEHLNSIIMGSKSKVYQPLLQRPVCDRVPTPRIKPF